MSLDVLLGLQWGDEGKGKIVDVLAPKYSMVARFQGGPNAGHTLEFDGHKHVLHQIPSGIFRPDILNLIGNGVVLDPTVFQREIKGLDPYNIDFSKNLFISKKAQVILPTHRLLDKFSEISRGVNKIGSTLKGIGPAYQDKIARQGIRVGDLVLPGFYDKYKALSQFHLKQLDAAIRKEYEPMEAAFFEAVKFIKEFNLVDGEYLLNEQLSKGKKVLAEGAQGTLLDIDFGSYPFVTSSNTTASGACSGLGAAPGTIKEVYGIFKAYCTRVGSGPFPTELLDAVGERIRAVGNEVGATTGRPRRCGWLDIPLLKYAAMINGVTKMFMMKADVLSDFDEIKICTHYKMEDGTITDRIPFDLVNQNVEPIYKVFKGWTEDLTRITEVDDLPSQVVNYMEYIEREVGIPIHWISLGPNRTQTITLKAELF